MVAAYVLPVSLRQVCAAQHSPVESLTLPSNPSSEPTNPAKQTGSASLTVRLRLEDESAFLGTAEVRLIPNEGYEVVGASTEAAGETFFAGLAAGGYAVEVRAPGFLALRLHTEIEEEHRQRIIYVVMKPRPMAKEKTASVADHGATTASLGANSLLAKVPPVPRQESNLWTDRGLDSNVSPVDASAECPAPQVLQGVGQRMEEFVQNLEKFSATEEVQHYKVDAGKESMHPETRHFTYVVTVAQDRAGLFMLEEYRNGSVDPTIFPANEATHGLPALDLLFHPKLAKDFTFSCEGLGQSEGKPAWQVRFSQRADRPVRIRSYRIGGSNFSVYLEGRAWIDPGSFQVTRLESDLQKPIPEIELNYEHISIRYAPVQFSSHQTQIWLPQEAELYVERKGRRYHRTHKFTDFRIFNVETAQNIQAPKGAYTFINRSGEDVAGVLTVIPKQGEGAGSASVKVLVPAHGKVFKLVGPGKDVNLLLTAVESATFVHNGKPDSISVEADLATETTLDVIPEAWVSQKSGNPN